MPFLGVLPKFGQGGVFVFLFQRSLDAFPEIVHGAGRLFAAARQPEQAFVEIVVAFQHQHHVDEADFGGWFAEGYVGVASSITKNGWSGGCPASGGPRA